MKKQYDAPKAEKVDFRYEENVVASEATSTSGTKCPCSPNPGGGGNGGPGWFKFYFFCGR